VKQFKNFSSMIPKRLNTVTEEILEKQYDDFFRDPPPLDIIGTVTPDQGIVCLNEEEQWKLKTLGEQISDNLKVKFIPASGAATRMFRDLNRMMEIPEGEPMDALSRIFFQEIDKFPFRHLIQSLPVPDPESCWTLKHKAIIEAILNGEPPYLQMPKALLPFHQYGTHWRKALEEHLRETSRLYKHTVYAEFTVSYNFLSQVELYINYLVERLEQELGLKYQIYISIQDSKTDHLAIECKSEEPVLDDTGQLVFFPSGHGALLSNLNRLLFPYIMIKNIDNIPIEPYWPERIYWQNILLGIAHTVWHDFMRIRSLLRLRQKNQADAIINNLKKNYFLFPGIDESHEITENELNRPLRVIAVVKNRGEPGGGPYWLRTGCGAIRLNILESHQLRKDQKNGRIWRLILIPLIWLYVQCRMKKQNMISQNLLILNSFSYQRNLMPPNRSKFSKIPDCGTVVWRIIIASVLKYPSISSLR